MGRMLDLSRARLGAGFVLSRRPTQLDVLVESVIQEHGTASPQCRIELQREGSLQGEWDADRLSQVISNLIGNALQHGEDREPVGIELNGRSPEGVVMRVRNAGRIPDDVLPDVFDPFRSGQRRRAEAEGLGLGLYIVEQVVLAHGGRISVELPAGGRHTVFCVTLPRGHDQFFEGVAASPT
jgi:two-component system, sensor histidine kinase and response regulator